MFVAKNITTDHKDLIHDVSYDFYGRRMATCSSDQSVKVWVRINWNHNALACKDMGLFWPCCRSCDCVAYWNDHPLKERPSTHCFHMCMLVIVSFPDPSIKGKVMPIDCSHSCDHGSKLQIFVET